MKETNPAIQDPASVFRSEESRRRILERYDRLLAVFDFAYRERTIETSFGPTYVLEAGPEDPPPLLLFHGSSSNSASWFADIPELTRHFHVFAVDLIGDAGHSAQTRPDMRTDAHALWIGELFAALGIGKASVMGNSLGAWMCLKFASVFPEKVDRMVLLAASGIAPVRLSFVLRLILYSLRGKKGGWAITRMVFGNDEIPQEVLDFIGIISENYFPYTGEIPVLTDAQMARLTMPVLYIGGEDDRLTNVPKCARRLRKILPAASVCVLPGRGHVLFNVLDRVIPFLRGEA